MSTPETSAPDHVDRIQAAWATERPDLDVSPLGVIGRLHRVGSFLMVDLLANYARFGLGEGDFDVLATLRRAGEPFELSPSDLARNTMVTTGAMTKRIDRLERAGLLTRRTAEADGRARVIALTSEGRDVIDIAFTAHIGEEHRLVAELDPRDRADLERILSTWLRRLDSAEDGGPVEGGPVDGEPADTNPEG
ncbi:MarR family transcriptional regulator [Mycetocola tolaasinivorans]|uniref:MarR family transcriptional regulator n=1 Tax=Mycetocola tolaasinivorans TaxID=76635 RepID=A0A3L7A871_9MICO|nr:MarR family transcriptional regulator [Mycetocola tolaasinivorans]RLP76058.1 MarR family transcriptional regulator [Mycetocola tolaasinivorans]